MSSGQDVRRALGTMEPFIQVFSIVILGILLLWFGYTLFFSRRFRNNAGSARGRKTKAAGPVPSGEGRPGSPRTCPVCSALLGEGERVKSAAFPGTGNGERLMHIAGCVYCLVGERKRLCPVCGHVLTADEFLMARIYDRPFRSHVHVIGCSRCKGPPSAR